MTTELTEAVIELGAKAIAWSEMIMALENSGVMAISPERLQATFDNAWNGTTEHDEECRQRCRKLARACLTVRE